MFWGSPLSLQAPTAPPCLSLAVGGRQKAQTPGERGEQTANAAQSSSAFKQTALWEIPARPLARSIKLDHSKWDPSQERHKFPDPLERCLAHPRGGASALQGLI